MNDTANPAGRSGGCQCGAIRYEITGETGELYACHCLECRKLTASAFSMSLMVRVGDFHLTRGEPNVWTRPTDAGNTLNCHFCPNCGSRVWHATEGDDEWLVVKPGSLDEPVDYGRAIHIWTKRKLPGFVIPRGAEQFPGEPE
jgi:hypothetical protein